MSNLIMYRTMLIVMKVLDGMSVLVEVGGGVEEGCGEHHGICSGYGMQLIALNAWQKRGKHSINIKD